jgi:hypothetical protein
MFAVRSHTPWGFPLAVMSLLVALLLGGGVRAVAAQPATPAATPVATAGVSCTALFGIADPASACLLAIHAIPDAAAFVDVYLDGALAVAGVEYGILGDFIEVPAGEHQVQVTAAGGDPAAAVIDEMATFQPGVAYEAAAVGLGADIQLLVQPVNTTVIADNQARLRVVHASPDGPAVDLAIAGGDILVSDLDYLATSAPLTVAPGTYDLVIRPAGSDEVIVPLGGTMLEPNVVYSFYIIGQVADGTIGGFVVPVALPEVAAVAATPVP